MRAAPWAASVFWMYTVLVDETRFGLSSRDLLRRLQANNIQTRPLWQPIHLSPARLGSPAYACPVAEQLNRQALSLPCSVGLTEEQQRQVIQSIIRVRHG